MFMFKILVTSFSFEDDGEITALSSFTPFRQSPESGVLLSPDPDAVRKEGQIHGGVPQREVPVYWRAGHKHPQRQSVCGQRRPGSA